MNEIITNQHSYTTQHNYNYYRYTMSLSLSSESLNNKMKIVIVREAINIAISMFMKDSTDTSFGSELKMCMKKTTNYTSDSEEDEKSRNNELKCIKFEPSIFRALRILCTELDHIMLCSSSSNTGINLERIITEIELFLSETFAYWECLRTYIPNYRTMLYQGSVLYNTLYKCDQLIELVTQCYKLKGIL